jgi:hypothetical protein
MAQTGAKHSKGKKSPVKPDVADWEHLPVPGVMKTQLETIATDEGLGKWTHKGRQILQLFLDGKLVLREVA